jgi:hypothetical protein
VGDYTFGKVCGSDAGVPCSIRALAERWNGTYWTLTPLTLSGLASRSSSLTGVSCATARFCVAVGGYEYGSGCTNYYGEGPCNRRTIIERWNGRRWRGLPTPAGVGALSAVSCSSSLACVAVGGGPNCFATGGGSVCSGHGAAPAERWNGHGWSLKATATVVGGADSALLDVSCVSARACTAVGTYPQSATYAPLAEGWSGTSWAVEPTPFDAQAGESNLVGVSCTSRRACTAVGSLPEAGRPLVQRWNGTRWTVQPSPNPPNAVMSGLGSVSCTSAVRCIAVGGSDYHNGATLAEAWNGKRWRIEPIP